MTNRSPSDVDVSDVESIGEPIWDELLQKYVEPDRRDVFPADPDEHQLAAMIGEEITKITPEESELTDYSDITVEAESVPVEVVPDETEEGHDIEADTEDGEDDSDAD